MLLIKIPLFLISLSLCHYILSPTIILEFVDWFINGDRLNFPEFKSVLKNNLTGIFQLSIQLFSEDGWFLKLNELPSWGKSLLEIPLFLLWFYLTVFITIIAYAPYRIFLDVISDLRKKWKL